MLLTTNEVKYSQFSNMQSSIRKTGGRRKFRYGIFGHACGNRFIDVKTFTALC